MASVKRCDRRCSELAEAFLADEPELNTPEFKQELALEIQQLIEDEIFFAHAERKAMRGKR